MTPYAFEWDALPDAGLHTCDFIFTVLGSCVQVSVALLDMVIRHVLRK